MRVRARKDANHTEIVRVIKDLGAQVIDIAQLGGGVPDLLVTTGNRTVLIEVKDGNKPPSKQVLTEDEKEFHATWKGELYIINSIDSAIRLINEIRKQK